LRLSHGDPVLGISLADDAGFLDSGVHRCRSVDDVLPSESFSEHPWRIDTVLERNDGGVFPEQRLERGRKRFDSPVLRGHDNNVAGSNCTRIELGLNLHAESTARTNQDEAVAPDRRQVPFGYQEIHVDARPPQDCSKQAAYSTSTDYTNFHANAP
jgi:hypothetical protein